MAVGRASLTLTAALILAISGCGSDSDDSASKAKDGATSGGGPTAGSDGSGGSTAAGPGSLVFGEETIALEPGRCYLQEQDSAGGGGKILATAQAVGTNAAGEEVRVDFTRYDENSQFFGDDISIDVGPVGSSTGYSSRVDVGGVEVSGDTVTASDIPMRNMDDGSEFSASFEIGC